MSATLKIEQKVNKGSDTIFSFYKENILNKVNIINKNVLLVCLGNADFISLVMSKAKNVCVIDNNQVFLEDFEFIDDIQLEIDIKNFLKDKNMPKFDVVIMNPPYGDNLHLNIFEKCLDYSYKIICIFPFTWGAKHNINLPKGEWRNKLQGKISNIQYFDHRTANDIFGTGNSIEDLAIVTYSGVNSNFDLIHYGFTNKKEYNLYKKIDFYNKPECITMSAAKNKSGIYGGTAEMFRNNKPKFYVPIYQWHGGANCLEACVIDNEKKLEKGCSYFCFNSDNEKRNFLNSLKTTFMNWFYFSFIKPGDNKEQAYLFRMSDYTKPWTDKRFCEYFGITGYISDTEAEPGSEWETILNTMKDFK